MARRKLTSVRWWLATLAISAGMTCGILPGCFPGDDDVKSVYLHPVDE